MTLRTPEELYAELKKEPHGRLAKMAADFILQLRAGMENVVALEREKKSDHDFINGIMPHLIALSTKVAQIDPSLEINPEGTLINAAKLLEGLIPRFIYTGPGGVDPQTPEEAMRLEIHELRQERDSFKQKFESMRDINDANLECYNNCAIENRALKEQVARLSAPVSDEEAKSWADLSPLAYANWIIAARVRRKEEKA